jgi:hypothetical protein
MVAAFAGLGDRQTLRAGVELHFRHAEGLVRLRVRAQRDLVLAT